MYKITILRLIFYGCETWRRTLKEKLRQRFSHNMELRKILVLRRDEVTGEWKGLFNEQLRKIRY